MWAVERKRPPNTIIDEAVRKRKLRQSTNLVGHVTTEEEPAACFNFCIYLAPRDVEISTEISSQTLLSSCMLDFPYLDALSHAFVVLGA